MGQIVRIDQELDGFTDTLSVYRQQLKGVVSQSADRVSRFADMPSLMGMERVTRFGGTPLCEQWRWRIFLYRRE